MAKQAGPVFFTGTIDGLIFYELNGQYYVRRLGKYKNKKQMRRSPRYEKTMKNADQFGEASALSKCIYYTHMPKEARKHGAFGRLTGVAYRLIQEGKSKEEVTAMLIAYCRSFDPVSTAQLVEPSTAPVAAQDEKATQQNKSQTALKQPISVSVIPPVTRTKKARYLSKHKIKKHSK